jgi:hypothetical protein
MPITDIIIVSVITIAFVAFAVVLAWGDYQTSEIARASRERALTGAPIPSLKQNARLESAHSAVAGEGKAPAGT